MSVRRQEGREGMSTDFSILEQERNTLSKRNSNHSVVSIVGVNKSKYPLKGEGIMSKYGHKKADWFEAIVDKLGGEEGAEALLRVGDPTVQLAWSNPILHRI